MLGLVSISFRSLPATEVIALAKGAGLDCIEWGSDIHAPPPVASASDFAARREILQSIAKTTRDSGLKVSSYGTYFRLGTTPVEEFQAYIDAAAILGTRIIRVWAGTKSYSEMSGADFAILADAASNVAEMAAAAGATVCLECHPNTATDCLEGTRRLLCAVASPALAMYWQPNQYHDLEWNTEYLRWIAPVVKVAHVFNWKSDEGGAVTRLPLRDGVDTWRKYLEELPRDIPLLLEFMPNNHPDELAAEAAVLRVCARLCDPARGSHQVGTRN